MAWQALQASYTHIARIFLGVWSSLCQFMRMDLASENFTPSARFVSRGALSALPEVLAEHMPGEKWLLLADDDTYKAAGRAVEATGMGENALTLCNLGPRARAEVSLAQDLSNKMEGFHGVLALGSGTINDLAKYASYLAGKPYIALATAASMNGYSSASASLKENGLKQSYAARAPVAVIADLDIIIAAPRRLAKAGIGDTLARTSVESDALMSHIIFQTPYDEYAFTLMRSHERVLTQNSAALNAGEYGYYSTLMHALLDAGDTMAAHKSSIFASQSEHMIVHTAELMYGGELHDSLHGELVALATLTTARLQQKMLVSPPDLKPLYADEALFARYFGAKLGAELQQQYHRKALTAPAIQQLSARLVGEWLTIKQRILAIQQSALMLERLYLQLGLPTKPTDIRLDPARWQAVLTYAHYTRDRFTFLDLAAMAGKRPV